MNHDVGNETDLIVDQAAWAGVVAAYLLVNRVVVGKE
jgi:hypothetical protein